MVLIIYIINSRYGLLKQGLREDLGAVICRKLSWVELCYTESNEVILCNISFVTAEDYNDGEGKEEGRTERGSTVVAIVVATTIEVGAKTGR